MELVKKSDEYKIFKKKSGRYAVKNLHGDILNAEKKTEILLKEKLITVSEAKPKPAEEAPAEEAAPEVEKTEEPAAEEAKAEEAPAEEKSE